MEIIRREIYPGYGRINCFASTYAEISIDNYCIAKKLYTDIMNADCKSYMFDFDIHRTFFNHVIVSVVFSAMAIEAFVNDYAASCMGDKLFYQNFDHLSVISKLQLIAEFILKTEFDKEESYYSNLKLIFSKRDAFVHSKSQSVDDFFEKNNITFSTECAEDYPDLDIENILTIKKDDLDEEFRLSKIAIKAMRDIAYFFDHIDSKCYAMFRLLGIGELQKDTENFKTVIADFEIRNINK